MAEFQSKLSENTPVLVPGRELVGASEPQPETDDLTKKLYRDAKPATFAVVARSQQAHFDFGGSGYFFDSHDHGLTNDHVVDGYDEFFVLTSDGKRHQAKVIDLDRVKDLAKLEVLDLGTDQNHWLNLSLKSPGEGERGWALGHPFGVPELYISPGKFLNRRASTTELLQSYELAREATKTLAQIEQEQLAAIPEPLRAQRLAQLRTEQERTDVHIEHGNSGGPFINKSAEAVGLMETSLNDNDSGMVPREAIQAFLDRKTPDFTFEYQNKSDASLLISELKEHQVGAVKKAPIPTAFGAIGLSTILGGSYKIGGASLGLLAADKLYENYELFTHSASPLARTEAAIKMGADSIALVGAAVLSMPKYRLVGKLALAAGAIMSSAASFLPTHLILTKTEKVESPSELPTPFEH
jgi:hypothetical protein